MSRYDENLSYIFDALSEDDRQLQIIEESAELIVAICKMIRARKGTNPTPVTTKQARAMMLEESADVAVSMEANATYTDAQEINRIKLEKAERWVNPGSRRQIEMKYKLDNIIAYTLGIVTLVALIAWFAVVLVAPFALVKLCWAFLTM